jgi:hypothetical protein
MKVDGLVQFECDHLDQVFRVARWYVFKTKNPNFGKFWRVVQRKMWKYFMAIWSILQPFGNFCCHLVYFTRFGILYSEKSGNPAGVLVQVHLSQCFKRVQDFRLPRPRPVLSCCGPRVLKTRLSLRDNSGFFHSLGSYFT